MRKEYGKALRELFAARMQADFPGWRAVPPPTPWYWPGERLYVLDNHPVAWLVIVLQPNLKDHDAFNVEVGWSVLRRVPELSMRPPPDDPHSDEAIQKDEYVCRLSELLPETGTQQGWTERWVIDRRTYSVDAAEILAAFTERLTRISAEQARSTLTPFVDDAMSALKHCGIPYLQGRLELLAARRHGQAG
jgi:hypothetical protein